MTSASTASLQAIVIHADDAAGRYRIHCGVKRLRAAEATGGDVSDMRRVALVARLRSPPMTASGM